MKWIASSTIIVAILLWATTNSVLACSCVPPGSPTEELDRATAVFSGTVVGIGPDIPGFLRGQSRYNVTFGVDQTWKGVVGKRAVVATETSSSTCGYGFQTGVSYLVYAYTLGEETLSTGLCTRTARVADAQLDLAELGAGSVPVEDSASLPNSSPSCLAGLIGGMLGLPAILGILRIARRKRADVEA